LEQQASKPEPAKQRERHDCDGLSAATAKIGGNRRKLGMRQVEAERKQNDRNANTGSGSGTASNMAQMPVRATPEGMISERPKRSASFPITGPKSRPGTP